MKPLTEKEVRIALRKAYNLSNVGYKHPSWVRVEEMTGINRTTACRIATSNYFPKDASIRRLLGVSALGEAPICEMCGIVHTSKCPHNKPRKRKDLLAYSPKDLLWMLENREEVQ